MRYRMTVAICLVGLGCGPRSDPRPTAPANPTTPGAATTPAGATTPAAPTAPALTDARALSSGCTTDAGPGVELDGTCTPLRFHAGSWQRPTAPPLDGIATAALARLEAEQCSADSPPARGDGAVFVHATCGGARGAVPGYLFRIDDGDGPVTRVAVPAAGGARVSFVAAATPLVVVVLNSVGTLVFDAATLDGRIGWRRMGGWFNATTDGASPSPDGAWFAVPDPYGGTIAVIRVADLAVVALVPVRGHQARDQGPGTIAWTGAGLEVTTYPLPYE